MGGKRNPQSQGGGGGGGDSGGVGEGAAGSLRGENSGGAGGRSKASVEYVSKQPRPQSPRRLRAPIQPLLQRGGGAGASGIAGGSLTAQRSYVRASDCGHPTGSGAASLSPERSEPRSIGTSGGHRQIRAAELSRIQAQDEVRRQREAAARDALAHTVHDVGRRSDAEVLRTLETAVQGAKAAGISGALLSEAIDAARAVRQREETRAELRAAVDAKHPSALLLGRAKALGIRTNDPAVRAMEATIQRAVEQKAAVHHTAQHQHAAQQQVQHQYQPQQSGGGGLAAADKLDAMLGDKVENGRRVLKGKLEVLNVVGEGAYGVVMRCRDKQTKETVAVKEFKINADDPDADEVRRTSKREVMVLKALKHPNIVTYMGEFYVGDKLYVMMEFVPRNLLEILEDAGHGLERAHVRHCIFQLCKAVTFIHGCGYVYRDIKPENLLVDSKGTLKLCDFGFARRVDAPGGKDEVLTDYVATRWYRAPELLLGPPYPGSDGKTIRTKYGRPVDMWAVGCLMGELTDGEPLFPGESDIDQLHRVQRCVGKLTPGQMMAFSINPNNNNVSFDNLLPPEGLHRRYAGKMNDVELDFVTGLLRVNPGERFTGEWCCRHAYFAEMPEAVEYVGVLDSGGC